MFIQNRVDEYELPIEGGSVLLPYRGASSPPAGEGGGTYPT